jgi:hypothetical protein
MLHWRGGSAPPKEDVATSGRVSWIPAQLHREVRGLAAPPQRARKLVLEWPSVVPTGSLRIPS